MREGLHLASLAIGWVAVMVAGCVCAGESTRRAVPEIEAPTSLDFGQVAVGRTAELSLAIGNLGLGPLDVTDVIVEGAQADAFDATSSTLRLQPGASGELSLVFRPREAGGAAATLVLTSNDPERPRVEVELRGEGLEPEFEVSPRTLDFGKVVLDTGRALEVEVTNLMPEPLVVEVGDVVPESATPHFDVALPDGTARLEIPAEGSASFQVVYQPAGVGAHAGSFTLEACPRCGVITVDLEGEGIATGLQVDPDALDFGFAHPDRPVTREVTFRNVGNVPVTVTEVGLAGPSGTGAADVAFTIETLALPLDLPPGSEVHVPVHFTPPDLTSHIASLVWRAPETPVPHGVVLLLGAGGGPAVEVSPLEVDFGLTAVAVPRTRKIAISNTGYTDLAILGHERTGSASFEVTGPETVVLAPEQTTELTVRYLPEAAGEDTARLRLLTDDPHHPDLEILLSGQGLELPPCEYETKPDVLDFGMVMRGRQVVLGFDVINVSGDGDCLVGPFRLMDDTPADFALAGAEEGRLPTVRLGPGEQMRVKVAFKPSTWSQFSGGVGFEVSDPGTPAGTVTLAGESTSSTVVVTPSTLDFGEVEVPCGFARRSFCITNTGGTDVRLMSIDLTEHLDEEHFVVVGSQPRRSNPDWMQLEPGSEHCVHVNFVPTEERGYLGAALVVFEHGEQEATAVTVGLAGEGLADTGSGLEQGSGCYHGRITSRLLPCTVGGTAQAWYGKDVMASLYELEGDLVVDFTVSIDTEGYFSLPNVEEGQYRLVLQHESEELELGVVVSEGLVTMADELTPPWRARFGFFPGTFDAIEDVVGRVGTGRASLESLSPSALTDGDELSKHQVLLINCGVSLGPASDAEVQHNLRTFVYQGGSLYVSHGSAAFLHGAWPGTLHLSASSSDSIEWFSGLIQSDSLAGALGKEAVEIYIGDSTPGLWELTPNEAVEPHALMTSEISGESGATMACFRYGQGHVVYSSFHHHVQPEGDIDVLMEYALDQIILRD